MKSVIKLLVGLGNPGAQYAGTRHNAGAAFVQLLADRNSSPLRPNSKFFGDLAEIDVRGHQLRALVPTTFMNRSGQAVAAVASFYKIDPQEILVVHDELDLSPGKARFKFDGGHGGHNGLRDIIPALGNRRDFHRLRIGIGHPGSARQVSHYVLCRAQAEELAATDSAIHTAATALPYLLSGDSSKAMTMLHSFDGAAENAP
ncbi:MAG: aminoacyl-tRNA hydrolase [Pseudomonadota bacterium]